MHIQDEDKDIAALITQEAERQRQGLEMIPSENIVSQAVHEAIASDLENKYAEGYPGARYYTGNEFVDQIETICRDRAKQLFGVPYVNVQPLSGAPANLEIFAALMEQGDVALSQELSDGGHLSMGQRASFTSHYYHAEYYHLNSDGEVNFDELRELARKLKPKIIWSGGTGYTRVFKWEKYAEIADEVGAYFVADISHIGGLVAGGAHPSPVPFAHVIMTTTHKTIRGPRGAMILVTQKGLDKNPELPRKIDYAVFPGHQGGPHMNKIAGIAVALKEAMTPEFKAYSHQIVANARALAERLKEHGFTLVGNGSENHMVWIDVRSKGIAGWEVHTGLEMAYIFGNKQTIPSEPKSPFFPSGYRLGTPTLTTRGMGEAEMRAIADFINDGVEIIRANYVANIASADKEVAAAGRRQFKDKLSKDAGLQTLKAKVIAFASAYPTTF